MINSYNITWVKLIPEIFNRAPNLDKIYKLSDKTRATIVHYSPGDPIRFDFYMSADHYELDIVNNYSEEDHITYTKNTVRIKSTRLLRFVESQLQSGSNNIILPLLG